MFFRLFHEIEPDRGGCPAACFPGSQCDFLIISNPYTGGNAGCVTYEPGVHVLIGGSGFACRRCGKTTGLFSCPLLDDLFHEMGNLKCGPLVQNRFRHWSVLFQDVAVTVHDPLYKYRFDVIPAVCKDGIC